MLEFLAKRLANEQATVVNNVVYTLDTVPQELFRAEDVPHLLQLWENVSLAEDTMVSTQSTFVRFSLKLLRRQLRTCSEPGRDPLVAFTLATLYRWALGLCHSCL